MGTPEMRKATDPHFSFAVKEQSSRDHYPGAHPIYSWSIYFASTIKLWSSAQGISIPGDTRTKTHYMEALCTDTFLSLEQAIIWSTFSLMV